MMKRVFLFEKSNIKEEDLLNKNELRKLYLQTALNLNLERKSQASKAACENLYQLSKNATIIASFSPLEPEIDITPFNKKMIEQKKLALPKVSGKDLIFYPVCSYDDLEKSKWGILEPKDISSPIIPSEISILLVPALCFDSTHYRLGRGKGFYDHFLSLHSISKSIGIGYKEQLSKKSLPNELHDQKLDQVLLF